LCDGVGIVELVVILSFSVDEELFYGVKHRTFVDLMYDFHAVIDRGEWMLLFYEMFSKI
jgi:hypothetical protein